MCIRDRVWDEETATKFYTQYYTDKDNKEKVNAFNNNRKTVSYTHLDNGKMGLVVGGQTVIPTEYEELIIAEDGFVLACKLDKWGALDIDVLSLIHISGISLGCIAGIL